MCADEHPIDDPPSEEPPSSQAGSEVPDGDAPGSDAAAAADLGPDLLAKLLGQLDPERELEIEELLAGCPAAQAELARLETDLAACREAPGEPLVPRAETFAALRDLIEDEAAERRADAAVRASPVAPELGADLVALALGELSGEERAAAERAADGDAACAAEVAAAKHLVHATRRALSLAPQEGTERRLLRLFARETLQPLPADRLADVPVPAARARRGPRLWHVILPTALAATILLAMAVMPDNEGQARIHEGKAFCSFTTNGAGATQQELDSGSGAFDFRAGQILEAGTEPVLIRVACRRGARAPGDVLGTGTAEFALQPGARLRRLGYAHFELLAGRVEIQAKGLEETLVVSSGEASTGEFYAAVEGTRFRLTASEERLVAAVLEGRVALGRRGKGAASLVLEAGEQGLVDARRLLRHALDGRADGDAFLAPRALLVAPGEPVRAGAALRLEGRLRAGPGGPVRIAAFDDSVPLFLVRLKGPGGREFEVKVQRSMIIEDESGSPEGDAWRLTAKRPYRLRLDVPTRGADGDAWEPGTWEARLRYMSYKTHSSGKRWRGVVESDPVTIEVLGE